MGKRLCAIVLAVVVGGGCASAPRTRSFKLLPRYLDTGNTIQLTETTGLTTRGRLWALSPTSLTILTDGVSRDVQDDRVARIRRPQRWIVRGALMGLGIGAGVGYIAGRSQTEPSVNFLDGLDAAFTMLNGMILGTAIGALVGGVVKVNRTVYEAPIPPAPPLQIR
jgi:hypothetical protein